MNKADLAVEADEEKIVLILLQRLFRKDFLGYGETDLDFGFENRYSHLFSNRFDKALKERFPLLDKEGRQYQLELKALSIFSHMYRYYLVNKNFDMYVLPSLT